MASKRTDQLRSELDAVTRLVGGEVTRTVQAANVADIDGWWDSRAAGLERVVAEGYDAAAELGGRYLTEHADLAGATVNPVRVRPDRRRIREALRITGPVAYKQNLSNTGSPDAAKRMMVSRSGRSAQRLALAGSRDTIMATVSASPVIVGYRRIAQPGACDFCLMLAGRGAVYSAATVATVGQRPRGNQRAGSSYHDSCRCVPEPVYASGRQPVSQEARDEAREGNRRRREQIDIARAEAQAARLVSQRTASTRRTPPDPALLGRWGVNEAQLENARAVVKEIKADIRQVAAKEADTLGAWLSDSSLGEITRPKRLKRQTDILTGQQSSVRTESGYDFLEVLGDAESARVRKRMVESDLFKPDVLAEQVRRKTNLDLSDDEAMDWVVDRWLQEDGLRSLASGRIPKYADPDNLIPSDYGLEGYRIEHLFSVDLDEAAGHVAAVQAEEAKRYAARTLGNPIGGPKPWEMEFGDYVRELEQVEDVLASTQLAAGVDPGAAYRNAQGRLKELAPADIDIDGNLNPAELFEEIRLVAQTAGLA